MAYLFPEAQKIENKNHRDVLNFNIHTLSIPYFIRVSDFGRFLLSPQ